MAIQDSCCSIAPYFMVGEENLTKFKQLCERFVESSRTEPGCLYYGVSFNGNLAHCREGYADAEALLAHLENVGPLLQEALHLAELTRLEIQGPASEAEKLRAPLAVVNPTFFILVYWVREITV